MPAVNLSMTKVTKSFLLKLESIGSSLFGKIW